MPNTQERDYFKELYEATKARNTATLNNLLAGLHIDIKDPIIDLTVAGKCAFEGDVSSAQFLYQYFNASPNKIAEGLARSGNFLQAKKWCLQYGAHPMYVAMGLAFIGDKENYAAWYRSHPLDITRYNIGIILILSKQKRESDLVFCQSIKDDAIKLYEALYCIAQVSDIETLARLVPDFISPNEQQLLLAVLSGFLIRNREQEVIPFQDKIGVYLNEEHNIILELSISIKKGYLIQHNELLKKYKSHSNFESFVSFSIVLAMNIGYLAYAKTLSQGDHFKVLLNSVLIKPFDGLKILHGVRIDPKNTTLLWKDSSNFEKQINIILTQFWSFISRKRALFSIQDPKLRYLFVNTVLPEVTSKPMTDSFKELNKVLTTLQSLQEQYEFNRAELMALFFYPIEISAWVLKIGPLLCKKYQLTEDILKYVTQHFSVVPTSETEFRPNKLHIFLTHLKEENNAKIRISEKQKVVLYNFFNIQPQPIPLINNEYKKRRLN